MQTKADYGLPMPEAAQLVRPRHLALVRVRSSRSINAELFRPGAAVATVKSPKAWMFPLGETF